MRRTTQLAVIAAVTLSPSMIAWRAAGESLGLDPQSKLWVEGKSTMRKFACKAPVFTVDVDAAPGAVSAVLAGSKAVHTVTVRVPAATMECGNGTMNEHMQKALKSQAAPTIAFTLAGYDVATGPAGVQGTLTGTLSLGGVERPIAIEAHAVDAGTGALRVTGSYELHMKAFGLKPPSLMMGTMKVDELVTVHFDLVLTSPRIASSDRP